MIVDALKTTLANQIEAANVVHGYHWNIEGINFKQYHDLFGEIYEDYQSQVDVIAEYIRSISNGTEYVNGSVEITRLNKTLTGTPIVGNKAVEMCKAIIILNDVLIENFMTLFTQATKLDEHGLANYCVDRVDYMNQLKWKLLASTK